MNYPVKHRQPVEGHPCWPFRTAAERASGIETEGGNRETGCRAEHESPAAKPDAQPPKFIRPKR